MRAGAISAENGTRIDVGMKGRVAKNKVDEGHNIKKNQHEKLPLEQRVKQYFEFYFSNKRMVPNASDPLHNR
ncbi:hypothetical protein LIER_01425 [Lithospermum erythrorhizon]|uniref:Uncharacterized protein n=1 Tax=Lithospermum erythrorhizon TaxID=34254 RepID=A0AAV3NKU9_LITER